MSATATYNEATKVLTVASNGLPSPVAHGTFPNDHNPNVPTEQDFDHDFLYRGGTFGTARTFDSNVYTHDGFIRSITLSVTDLTVFTGNNIQPGDHLMFKFSDGLHLRYLYKGTEFTSIAGECWLAADDRLDLIMDTQEITPVNGTYEYWDSRNGRTQTPLGNIGIAGNGVAIFNPSAGSGLNPPAGFSWVAAGDAPFVNSGEDNCGGHPTQSGEYHYHDPHFLDCWKANSTMASYNDYYGNTQFNGNNIRHPDGHSKIIGICFDGFPIYGPFGYDNPFDNLSGTRTMRTQYGIRDQEAPGRPDYGTDSDNPPAGALMEDYEYVEGSGDLDIHNGRYCFTPEYPTGTYAYFLTVDPDDNDITKFPYIIGNTTRETIDTTFTVAPVSSGGDGGDGGDPPIPPTLQFTLQPQNVTVNSGQTATFNIQKLVIPEDGPVSYQWYRSTDGGFAFAVITGATADTYSLTALPYMTGYRFRCRITGPNGAPVPASNSPLDSQAAILTVTGAGDGGSTDNRFDSTSSTMDSTLQSYDGT